MTHRPNQDSVPYLNTWRLMESSLHRQLKGLYGNTEQDREVLVDGFRIDAVSRGRLIEIQRASLSAIRDKIATLVERHRVTLVKPLAARTLIVKRSASNGPIISQRYSPLRQSIYHLFQELVHFGTVFPNSRLQLEVVLIEQEEHRIPRPRRRFRRPDFQVEDRLLRGIISRHSFRTARDLAALLPAGLPVSFHSQDLATMADIPRWLAQKMIYCLRQAEVIIPCGKQGNTILYQSRLKPQRQRRVA